MKPSALGYFYRRRLRAHLVQELFAGAGIAVAVALVLSTLVAEGSIAGSTSRVVHAIVGPATLQLKSRTQNGFSQAILARVEALPGVRQAAPVLEQSATARGPGGRQATLELAGTDLSLATLDGLAHTLPISALVPGGIGLTRTSASQLRVGGSGQTSTLILNVRGRRLRRQVTAVLGHESAGSLSEALVAVMSLSELQHITGLKGMISRVLVQNEPGRRAMVERELRGLAGGRLLVSPATQDVAVLREALKPSDQAGAFFAGVAGVLGLLFAFTAMLLTVPERRRAIADLRLVGAKRGAIIQMIMYQALCLGVMASAFGVLVGYALSRWALHQATGYLAEAFTLGTGTVVTPKAVLLAFATGVLACCAASAVPLLDLRRGRRLDAIYAEEEVPGTDLSAAIQLRLTLAALALVAVMFAVISVWPSFALPGSVLLAIATVLIVPVALSIVLVLARGITDRFEIWTVLPVALASLKATSLRSLALAATGGVAIFGSVALGGARSDLLRGIKGFSSSYTADASIWVVNPDDNQAVIGFYPDHLIRRIAAVPGVASAQSFQGTFDDLGRRRVWIIARPPGASSRVLASQILHGDQRSAETRMADGGAVIASLQLAEAQNARIGGTIAIPTPSGTTRMRLAATTTNLAWSPGVVFIDSRKFSRLWGNVEPSAIGVALEPGIDPRTMTGRIRSAIGPGSGLEVSTAATRRRRIDTLTSEGLGRLGQIAGLLSLAAILAMAAALGSSIWQRRLALAGLRLAGVKPPRLRRILLTESLMMLGAGCVTGAALGIVGEAVIDGYLRHFTGFPVAGLTLNGRPLEVLGVVLAGTLALIAIPTWLASRASPALALEAPR
jgi:putative ABC transport system permease protein